MKGDDEMEKLWKVFRKGFLESGEGWNGEYPMNHRPEPTMRRVRARFEALYDAGKFDE